MSVTALLVPGFLDTWINGVFRRPEDQQPESQAQAQAQAQQHAHQPHLQQQQPIARPRRPPVVCRKPFMRYMPRCMIDCACERVRGTLPCKEGPADAPFPPLHSYITQVLNIAPVNVFTVAVALIYLNRFRSKIPSQSIGNHDTYHRLFMVAIMLASKFLNDQSLTNKAWARVSQHFTLAEINLMELDFLSVLEFQMYVDRSEVNAFLMSILDHPSHYAVIDHLYNMTAPVIDIVDSFE